jgi:hypothetical protein
VCKTKTLRRPSIVWPRLVAALYRIPATPFLQRLGPRRTAHVAAAEIALLAGQPFGQGVDLGVDRRYRLIYRALNRHLGLRLLGEIAWIGAAWARNPSTNGVRLPRTDLTELSIASDGTRVLALAAPKRGFPPSSLAMRYIYVDRLI